MSWKKIMTMIRSSLLREDHVCPWWLAYTFDNPLRKLLHDPASLLAPYVRQGMTVADIGCGLGYFSLALAKMAGEKGRVIAVDIQQEMLNRMLKRAGKHDVADRIQPVLAAPNDIRISEQLDFILAFWMVHEARDIPAFFRQVFSVLKRDGAMLIAEPRIHVSSLKFEAILDQAREAGFVVARGPRIAISRSAVLKRKQ